MTAAQIKREFYRLKDLQRLLRLHEREHGTPLGTACLRRDVVEHMRRLAKLMKYGAPAVLLLALLPSVAWGQEHRHPAADVPMHEKFYSGWFRPDMPTQSCCSNADCYPTEARRTRGQWQAKRREDGKWMDIPASKIEMNRDSPDGRNHLCAPPPAREHVYPSGVICFIAGGGT
jgi:hypothetical protein